MTEVLQQLLHLKLDMEIAAFKKQTIKLEGSKIYDKAYEIDSMVNLYELLSEISQEIEEDTLKRMLQFPNLLTFFYERWLKRDDTIMEDFRESIKDSMQEINKICSKLEVEVRTE